MPTPFQLVLGVAVLVGLGVLFLFGRRLARAFVAYRGTRVVVCPENREMVAVAVDAGHAAWIRLLAGVAPTTEAIDRPVSPAEATRLLIGSGLVSTRPGAR